MRLYLVCIQGFYFDRSAKLENFGNFLFQKKKITPRVLRTHLAPKHRASPSGETTASANPSEKTKVTAYLQYKVGFKKKYMARRDDRILEPFCYKVRVIVLYVCVYVCIYIRMYIRMYECMYVCMYVCVCVYIYIYIVTI